MGKSFNDDVFTNGINIDSINGLNIRPSKRGNKSK